MWLAAFPATGSFTLGAVISFGLVLTAMVLSVVAFARGGGAEYELRGSRAGLVVAIGAILAYLVGTSVQSGALHVFSIAAFYWGCVLYLGGTRSLVSTLPCGLIVLSLFAPMAYGNWGLIYLDGFSWALVITSAALLWETRKRAEPLACVLCAWFQRRGDSFCGSCGRLLGSIRGPSSRRFVGFGIFAILLLVLLTLTVPFLVATPRVSLVNIGLGGPQNQDPFAPLQGWSANGVTLSVGGVQVVEYVLTQGKVSIEAFVASSLDSQTAASAINGTKVNAVGYPEIPASISQSMSGYSFEQKGTKYIGLQGVFPVDAINGSSVEITFVAVDLRQTAGSFAADQGSALFSAAANVIGWTSASEQWSVVVGNLLSGYQSFSQAAYVCSFAVFGVVLFTVARDDELVKVRRLESMEALGKTEMEVLRAFDSSFRPLTGEQLRDAALKLGPWIPESGFYSALGELARRDLVSPSVVIQGGRPKLFWKRLVQ
jgi:hypothetical protein